MNLSLLHTPDGVRDFYGTELDNKNHIMDSFEKNILLYGYDEIQTPTLEFMKVFSEEGDFENKTFRFIDRDGETLVLRPDYTPSVARCAAKYFSDEKEPLRLFYKGNAFSQKGIYEGKAIEVTQMGIELLKDDSYVADAEVLTLVEKNLLDIDLKDFKICVSSVNKDNDRLEKIIDLINKSGFGDNVYIDLSLESNFKYYTGMIFKVYTYGVGDSVCKGGRYNSLLKKYGDDVPAVGCVFMIDNILQSMRRQKITLENVKKDKIFVKYNDSNLDEKIKYCDELRNKGVIAVLIKE